MNSRKLCAVCGVKSTLGCSKCKLKYYCSKDHQSSHWEEEHKANCMPIHVRVDQEMQRRVYVAKKDIKEGQVIFTNRPFMVFPIVPAQLHPDRMAHRHDIKVCMGCCQEIPKGEGEMVAGGVLSFNRAPECPVCKWPVCNEECAKKPFHAKLECEILSRRGTTKKTIYFFDDTATLYNRSYILRALLMRDVYPDLWTILMDMPVHTNPAYLENEMKIMKLSAAIAFIRDECKQVQFDKELIQNVYWILEANLKIDSRLPFCAKLDNMSRHISQGCLYNLVSYHCSSEDDPESSTLEKVERHYFALSDIAKGESLKLPIIAVKQVSGTLIRRQTLFLTTGILCSCRLCKDPTEFETYLSAVRCQLCKPEIDSESNLGYLLPIVPLFDKSPWKCNKCSKEVEPIVILPMVTRMENALRKLDAQCSARVFDIINEACHVNELVLNKNRRLTPEEFAIVEKSVNIIPEKILTDMAKLLADNQQYLHRNHFINIRARQAYLDYLYLYISLNRSNRFAPSSISVRESYSFPIKTAHQFLNPSPERWMELNKELYSLSEKLLQVFQRILPDRSLPCGGLFYCMTVSKWAILREENDAKNAKSADYEKFLVDFNEWRRLKQKADNCFRIGVFPQGISYSSGIVKVLEKMDFYDTELNKDSFDTFLQKMQELGIPEST